MRLSFEGINLNFKLQNEKIARLFPPFQKKAACGLPFFAMERRQWREVGIGARAYRMTGQRPKARAVQPVERFRAFNRSRRLYINTTLVSRTQLSGTRDPL
ncbi:hypothetical protein O6H91_01G125300 [Diphasiastrum complanatum]|uniref:Uncharacterized protein n=1 Tax=Diphasiastrum complanatum TaxID=34168 RepID=A0ACC2EVH3_DIPCM|nr:hypothetical protein O6H91_01G125300 [Diphasiastrum complanatum]